MSYEIEIFTQTQPFSTVLCFYKTDLLCAYSIIWYLLYLSIGRNSSSDSKHILGKCITPGGHHDEDRKTIPKCGLIEKGLL